MAFFDPDKKTEILVDASPVGVAGILSQDGLPVAYASRALTPVEQRYSQTEREALAVIWGCEHFHIFIYGAPVRVITDHKPLLGIWKKISPPPRIARWGLRLQPYDINLVYRQGDKNPADYMSRHPAASNATSSRQQKVAEDYINFIADTSMPGAITLDEVKQCTLKDSTLQQVMDCIHTGQWWHNSPDLMPFRSVQGELSVNSDNNVLLRDSGIVLPASLQAHAVRLDRKSVV
jgi:hypothetical protein